MSNDSAFINLGVVSVPPLTVASPLMVIFVEPPSNVPPL